MITGDGLLGPAWSGAPVDGATADPAVLRALLDAEAALARAQNRPDLADAITAAEPGDLGHSGGNPVIPLVKALPEGAHDGATSQDVMDTALMLVAARARRLILPDLASAAGALEALAREHRDTPMPGRTLTQHAVPTTFGLKAAGWRSLVLDAYERLGAVTLPAQLGGAGGTLATLSVPLMERFACELGLAVPVLPWHVLRTPVADLAGALAFCCGALGKIAADVLVLSRTEIGEVAEGSGGGSSAMPHKSNPVHATLVAACARQAPALAAILYGAMAAEDERPAGAWHAEWEPLRTLLRLAGGAAFHTAALTGGLRVHPARMRENLSLTGGLIVAERVMGELSRQIGKKAARELLETASRDAARLRMPLRQALELACAHAGVSVEITGSAVRRPGPTTDQEGGRPRPVTPDHQGGPAGAIRPDSAAEGPGGRPGVIRIDPALFDPTGYSGAAGELVDRALDRRLKEIADVELPR
ncbi:lyase family protein [Herbidospora sp. NBRC 101105]|uniref:lyase family protein n=1 Tax=Herbidospora sp. NBRC 101105 TaxID=3032195 RepID=UPI0024A309F0|nr:lyase family protein [Herbidospora sp. NBRC 101105]GLX93570.1 3-carboxy-cis,cis-muconate cycloisomerase [Herbidospora sp. NBRC 101105]